MLPSSIFLRSLDGGKDEINAAWILRCHRIKQKELKPQLTRLVYPSVFWTLTAICEGFLSLLLMSAVSPPPDLLWTVPGDALQLSGPSARSCSSQRRASNDIDFRSQRKHRASADSLSWVCLCTWRVCQNELKCKLACEHLLLYLLWCV